MKALIRVGMLACLLVTASSLCAQEFARANQKDLRNKSKALSAKSMQGAYAMERMVVTQNGRDTVMNLPQMKMYTGGYMLYVRPIPGDSLAEYGVATYEVKGGKLIEHVFFTSAVGDVKESYELRVDQANDGYTQVIEMKDEQRNPFTLYEAYKRKDGKSNTPLDGAWKQTDRSYINKEGTAEKLPAVTQFKFYQSGHFAWVGTEKDAATNKLKSSYGYGTFSMKNRNEVVENNTSSTFISELVNKPVTVQVNFSGADNFSQTITWPDGAKLVETYTRMK